LNASHADRGPVLVDQHVACETLGTIEDAICAHRLTLRYVRVPEGDPIPSRWDDTCGLIVMGGPMSVEDSERLPHLAREMRLIESALAADRLVLGVGLGASCSLTCWVEGLLQSSQGDRLAPRTLERVGPA